MPSDAGAKNASTTRSPSRDAGRRARDADGGSAGKAGAPNGVSFDAGSTFNPPYCPIHVGAECDDSADCPRGNVCCAHFDQGGFGYASIRCEASCSDLDRFALCHAGQSCSGQYVCRASVIIPFSFISVCAPLVLGAQSATTLDVKGKVACGATSCDVGSEKCCLTAHFDSGATFPMAEKPYCAPLAEECACDPHPDSVETEPEIDAGASHH